MMTQESEVEELPSSTFGFKYGTNSRNDYTKRLFYPDTAVQKYDKNSLFLGWKAGVDEMVFDEREKKPHYLKLDESFVSLIIGMRGSGKTMWSRGAGARAFLSGYAVIYLTDIKGEMETNNKPVQKKFANLLNTNEKPMAIPTVSLLPVFMEKTYAGGFKPPNIKRFQFSLNDLSESEWIDLLHPSSELQRELIKNFVNNIQNGNITDYKELVDFIQESDYTEMTTRSIVRVIENLIEDNVLGDAHPIDLCNLLENNIVAINFVNFEYLDTRCGYPQIYVSILLRKIMELRKLNRQNKKKGLSKKVNIFLDEAHAFCPRTENPSSKEAIDNAIKTGRSYNISLYLATQYVEQLPDKMIVNQVRYFFIPYNTEMDTLTNIVKRVGWYQRADSYSDKWQDIRNSCKKYWWMVIDKSKVENREVVLLQPAAPLCHHLEE